MKTLSVLLIFITSLSAFANNQFIPNYYKNRRQVNQYSAIGWSVRNEVGLLVSQEKSEESYSTGNSDSESTSTSFVPRVYYRMNDNLNLELQGSFSKTETDFTQITGNSETEGTTYLGSLGYEMDRTPMAFGVTVSGTDAKSTSSGNFTNTTSQTNALFTSVGAGYELKDKVFLGLGYSYADANFSTQDLYLSSYAFGIGKVYGDKTNPDAAVELIFSYSKINIGSESYEILLQGLINAGAFQYFAELSYDDTKSSLDDKTSFSSIGVDYGFGNFFVSPLVSYQLIEFENDSTTSDLFGSLQLGYRNENFETYVLFNISREEDENNQPPFVNSDEDSQEVTLAAIYKF